MVATRARIIEEDGCGIRMVHLDRVAKAREDSLGRRELDRLSLVFKLLGDQTRLRLVTALRGGEMCVCDLAATLDLSESAVSHQLRRLRDAALLRNRREGPVLYYSLDDDHVTDLLRLGLEHVTEESR